MLTLFGAVACAAQPVEPPKPPPKQAQSEEKKRSRVPHVAPPPAYGNKVVFTTGPVAAEEHSPIETL